MMMTLILTILCLPILILWLMVIIARSLRRPQTVRITVIREQRRTRQ